MNNLPPWLAGKEYVFILIPFIALAMVLLAVKFNRPPDHPDQNVLAAYQDGVVTQEQVVEHFRMASAQEQLALRSVEGVRHLIQDLAVHEVVAKWATERQVDTKETFRRALKDAADVVTLHDVAQRMHEFDVKIEESEIQKYFDDNRDQFKGQSLTQVKEQIRNLLHAQKEQTVIDDFNKQLRANATVTLNADLLDVPAPADAELQSYYQNNLDAFREPDRVRVDEIRVKAKDKADRALARVQAGEEFSQVAFETNEPSFVANNDLIARGARGAAFDTNVFILSDGQVSKVFQDGDAYLVVRLAEKRPGRVKAFDEVHETLSAKLRAEREQSYYAEKKNEILLSVNGIRYTLADFLEEYNALPADLRAHYSTREQKRQLVDAIADRLLILQSVPARLAQSQNQKEMEETRRHVLAEILHDEEMEGQLDVTDADIEEHYKGNPRHYATPPKVKISYIRIGRGVDDASRKAAVQKVQAAYKRLQPDVPWQTGEDFAAVAREVSEDAEIAQKGGVFEEWITLPPSAIIDPESYLFITTVLSLKAGEISPPFAAGDSYFIVLARERVDAQPQPLDQVRDLVRADVRDTKHEQALTKFEQELARRMGLNIHEDRLNQVVQELAQP
ncbi:MAG: peptidyl-prolyl cis-trans isomerase [Chloroflexi bacterium]|nr:peptidyl-prolyl cis-trans isomerase [Chloroflexota bacterium]